MTRGEGIVNLNKAFEMIITKAPYTIKIIKNYPTYLKPSTRRNYPKTEEQENTQRIILL
jgi:hypothetical protein